MKQKTIRDNEKVWEDLVTETKEIYDRNLQNSEKVDAKAIQFYTFTTALLLLFIQFIKFPDSLPFLWLYGLAAVTLLTVMVLLALAYKPTGYFTIDSNKLLTKYHQNGYPQRTDLLKAMAGTTAENTNSVKANVQRKTQLINTSANLLVAALLLIILLKITQGM